ncbi:MAG: hypothetical protein Q7S52_03085 [bacterium]|nr:hypothetical protein [bacterium]
MLHGGLSHKGLTISAVIALSAVLLIFFLTRSNEFSFGETALLTQTLTEIKSGPSDIDTDRDGLPDWKEKLYGSNIEEADSDRDGTNDGDEVRVGRNPAVANTGKASEEPTDKLAYLEDQNIATSSTDLLGIKKEFFARYLAEGSKEVKEGTFQNLMKTVDVKKFAPQHELLGLTISSDNNAAGIKVYINAFGTIIKKYLKQPMKMSEDALLKAVMTKKDRGAEGELQLLAIAYKNFATDLLAIQVPSALAQAHLLIVNGYKGMGIGLLSVAKIHEDPINGTAGYEAYLKYRLDVIEGYGMIVAYVVKEHITFAGDEPGYPFYWITTAK